MILKLRKYKIKISPESAEINTLQSGDIVNRQYFDGKNTIYSLMYVENTGIDMVADKDGVKKEAPYFIGQLLFGDEPKTGELLNFVRVTSLSNSARGGALYLTSSDSNSPYLDVINVVDKNSAVFSLNGLGSFDIPNTKTTHIQNSDEYVTEVTSSWGEAGMEFPLLNNSPHGNIVKDPVLIGFMSIKPSKDTVMEVFGTKFNLKGDEFNDIFMPIDSSDMIGSDLSLNIHLSSIGGVGDYFSIRNLIFVPMSAMTGFDNGTKTRIGQLSGIVDEYFGALDSYGAYFQKIYATKDVNIAGTLTAGSKDGQQAIFYVGKIRTNAFMNSMSIRMKDNSADIYDSKTNPVGIGNVYKSKKDSSFYANNDLIWHSVNSGALVCFSMFIMPTLDEDNYVKISAGGIDTSVSVTPNIWNRIYFYFSLPEGSNETVITLRNADVLFCAPQLELGVSPSIYQPTDEVSLLDYNDKPADYGMWATKGGFGGTIQNPIVKLNDEGVFIGDAIQATRDGVKINLKKTGIDDAINKRAEETETRFEIKEGQISSTVTKLEVSLEESKKEVAKAEQTVKDAESIKTSSEQELKDAKEELKKAQEVASSNTAATGQAKDDAEQAVRDAQKKVEDAQSKVDLAANEATKAKKEADKAALAQKDVTQKQTEIIQTAEEIEITASSVTTTANAASKSANEAAIKAEEATLQAEEADKKAKEALASSGVSSAAYLNAKKEAEKAFEEASIAADKATEASKSAADAQSSLEVVTEKETNILQTAEKIESTAVKVESDASTASSNALKAQQEATKSAKSATDAQKNATSAQTQAENAEQMALEAAEKAEEALASAGESSSAYLSAKAEADKANKDALSAKEQASLADKKAALAKGEADRAKIEADKAADINTNITELNTQITQTAEGITATATEVSKQAGVATEASLKAESEATKASKNAEDANSKALEATKKAEEALASAGASSQSYLDAKAEADKAVSEALKANSEADKAQAEAKKAKTEADKALASQNAITIKQTEINQTAEEINLKAVEVNTNATEAKKQAVIADTKAKEATEASSLANEKAEEANEKALEANKKAEEALASSGASSEAYENAKLEAEKANTEAVKANTEATKSANEAAKAKLEADKAIKASADVTLKQTEINQTAEAINLKATEVSSNTTKAETEAKKAQASATTAQTNATNATNKAKEAQDNATKTKADAAASNQSKLDAQKKADEAKAEAIKANAEATKAASEAAKAKLDAASAAESLASVTEKEASITTTAEGVDIKAKESRESADRAVKAEASINVKADGIVMQVSSESAQKAIDGLQIKSNNMLDDSRRLSDATLWIGLSGNWSNTNEKYEGCDVWNNSFRWRGFSQKKQVKAGEPYTYSIMVRKNSNGSIPYLYLTQGSNTDDLKDADITIIKRQHSPTDFENMPIGEWFNSYITFIPKKDGVIFPRLEETVSKEKLSASQPMLLNSSKPSDWGISKNDLLALQNEPNNIIKNGDIEIKKDNDRDIYEVGVYGCYNKLELGKKYILTIDATGFEDGDVTSTVWFINNLCEGGSIGLNRQINFYSGRNVTQWVFIAKEIDVAHVDGFRFRIYNKGYDSTSETRSKNRFIIHSMKLTEGNIASDKYSSSPKDQQSYTDKQITSVRTDFDVIEGQINMNVAKTETLVNQTTNLVEETKQTATQINQTAEEINLKAVEVNTNATEAKKQAVIADTKAKEATEASSLANEKAEEANEKALEANKKAEEALASSGASSEAYENAKLEAEKANKEAMKASTEAGKATTEAKKAKLEADKALASQEDVTLKQTEINQTASEIKLSAKEVSDNTAKATEASATATKKATEATTASTNATKKATEADAKAKEALASAGISSESYKSAKLEADKAVSEALKASNKAKEANQSAIDAKNSLTNITKKETAINQTAEKIESTATIVTGDALKAKQAADLATSKATEATANAQTAKDKATEAQLKAEEALKSAGESSQAYKNAKLEAGKAVSEATKAANKASEANKSAANAQNALNNAKTIETKVTQTANEVNLNAKKVVESADRAVKAEASINVKADGIVMQASSESAKKAIDGLEIGGDNYLVGSAKPKRGDGSAGVKTTLLDDGSVRIEGVKYDSLCHSFYNTDNFSEDGLVDGELITISLWLKSTTKITNLPTVYIRDEMSYVGTKGSIDSDGFRQIYVTRQYKKSQGVRYFNMHIKFREEGTYYFKCAKIEKGNKPTDWSPAPEDLVAEAVSKSDAKLTVTANEIRGEVNTNKKDADGKITSLNTRVSQTEDKISQTVSKTEYNANNQAIGSKITKIEQDTSNITLDVTNNKKDADDKIIGLNSRVTVAEKNINLKVSQTDYNANNAKVSEKFASIDVKANKIELKVDSIEIGGVNLIPNSANPVFYNNGSEQTVNFSPIKKGVRMTLAKGSDANTYTPYFIKDKFKQAYVTTCIITTHSSGLTLYRGWKRLDDGLRYIPPSTTTRVIYKGVFDSDSARVVGFFAQFQSLKIGDYFDLTDYMSELGNKPSSSWSPNYNDIQSQFTETNASLKVLNDKIASEVSKTNGIRTDLTTLSQSHNSFKAQVKTDVANAIGSNNEVIKSSFEMNGNKIGMMGKDIDLTGKVSFSALNSESQNKINTANSTASTALSNANNAQSSASNANSSLTSLKSSLGDLAYADKVEKAKLGSTIIEGGFIKTELIKTDELVSKKVKTANSGPRFEMEGSEMKVYGDGVHPNMIFGVNEDGYAVMEYYTPAGDKLYDLGPSGINILNFSPVKWTEKKLKQFSTEKSRKNITSRDFSKIVNGNVTQTNSPIYYNYYAGGNPTVSQEEREREKYTYASINGPKIADGWYYTPPHANDRGYMQYPSNNSGNFVKPEAGGLYSGSYGVVDRNNIYIVKCHLYLGGILTDSANYYFQENPKNNGGGTLTPER